MEAKAIVFCAHESDELGIRALDALKNFGCKTEILSNGKVLPETAIAIFEVNPVINKEGLNWPGHTIRTASHLLMGVAPDWAKGTPLLVGIKGANRNEKFPRSFESAMKTMAMGFVRWFLGLERLPWGNCLPVGERRKLSFDSWLLMVGSIPRGEGLWNVPEMLVMKTKKKTRARGQGWQVLTSKQRVVSIETEAPTNPATLRKEAAFIALLGAFNLNVCLAMLPEKMHSIFLELRKRLALVAEAASISGGQVLFELIDELSEEDLSQQREKVASLFEAALLYGKRYEELDDTQKATADEYQICDEQAHFARIMDVDDLGDDIKKMVGVADAGNPFIVRCMMNAVRYREDKGIKVYYPLSHQPIVEAAKYKNPLTPSQVRVHYPYAACVVSASDDIVARDLMEIYRKLIVQYPLEVTFLLMEEWLMGIRNTDPAISFTAVQVIQKSDGVYEAKAVNVGGGLIVIRGSNERMMRFEPDGLTIGSLDDQISHQVMTVNVAAGDEIFVFPKDKGITDISKINRAGEVCMRVNAKRQMAPPNFEWTNAYVLEQLAPLIDQIMAIGPKVIDIEFGHTHGDREPGADQILGSKITGWMAKELQREGIYSIQTRPMSDNYHVLDRLNFPSWVNLLQLHSELEITEVNFEDALITRHLGDELIAFLHRTQPQNIIERGGNYYFQPPGGKMMVELYDGVITPDARGRMGCVPFQIGYELYRLNPELVNQVYQRYIFDNFSGSLVAEWWREDPRSSYQDLMLKHVYLLPCAERMELKMRIDQEIDRPYAQKCISGETPFMDAIFNSTNIGQIVLLHILECFYDAQEKKSATLWQALGLPKVNQWRISFNRYTGESHILDWNRPL